jgi:predicted nucleic acid-binding protein
MPEVVSNTTPLQYLHQAGVLGVLPGLYERLVVPAAVADEIRVGREAGVDLPDLPSLGWIEIRSVEPSPWPVARDIHRGEAEVLALAGSAPETLMLLDDLAARRHARLLNLKFTGTLGVLLRAKREGLIPEVGPVLDRMEECGFRLAQNTRSEVLGLAGESE